MEGCVAPYLQEVGLAGSFPGQFKGTYVRMLLHIHAFVLYSSRRNVSSGRAYLDSRRVIELFYTPRALEMSSVSCALTNTSKFFAVCVVCVQLHTQVFLKFKSSCTVSHINNCVTRSLPV